MSTFWAIASNQPNAAATVQSYVGYMCDPKVGQPTSFSVPTKDLKFGSFDDLIRMTDEMQKHDSQVEGIARRIERQYQEVDPNFTEPMSQTQIISNTQNQSFSQYLSKWQWDEAKFPKSRGLQNTLTLLLSTANKIDEEGRAKGSQFSEVKTAVTNMDKKEKANLSGRDMIDIFTPNQVNSGDFVYTEHLTTLVVILPSANVEQFLNGYERYAEKVVPLSARSFPRLKEDDNELWRVVVFKCCVDNFMKAVRESRVGTCRQFEYSEAAYAKVQEQRRNLRTECDNQTKIMKGFCKAALSDVMVAWTHLKAMRVFVESTLRFGHSDGGGDKFTAMILAPKDQLVAKARIALGNALGGGMVQTKDGDEEEDYFPYVSVSFTPFSVAKVA
jgi:V-type H+-transporting ATPase subunit C